MGEDFGSIPVIPYTPAKRYPNMTGDIGGYRGWPLPGQTAQVAAAVVAVGVLYLTRAAWAHFGIARLAIFPAFVLGAYYAARAARPEGRTPVECLLGFLVYVFASHRLQGHWCRGGRFLGVGRRETVKGCKTLMVPGADWRKPIRQPRTHHHARHALRWSR